MEPMKHEVEMESVPESRQTTVDNLTTLPPELIGLIYDAIYSMTPPITLPYVQFPHQFQPIHSRLLHFQRVNLYREVVLNNDRRLRRFATTIQGNGRLGELVKRLDLSGSIKDIDEVKEKYGDQTIREMINSISPHLTKVSYLSLYRTSLTNVFYDSRSHHSLLAQLTRLHLSTKSTDYFAKILPLSPRLSELWIDATDSPVSSPLFPPSTQPRPRIQLTSLTLFGDFSDPQMNNLIGSLDLTALSFFGLHLEKGLRALQDPNIVHRLSLDADEQGVESELMAIQLARFTHLTHLTLVGELGMMPWLKQLFSTSMTQLEVLELCRGFEVDTDLLLECLPLLSKRLKTLKLDNIGFDLEFYYDLPAWTNECQPEGVEEVIERFKAQGIEVYGMTVDAVAFEQRARSSNIESSKC